MSVRTLYVWNGSPDDKLDVLRYVHAADDDVRWHPVCAALEQRIAVLEAALRPFADPRAVFGDAQSPLWLEHLEAARAGCLKCNS